jgi:drug/metabolite transporter (DMT)-like permease
MNTPAKPATINGVDLMLILIVTFSWGLNYPIMKFVVMQYPPASFRALTFILGTLAIGLYALWKRDSLKVPTGERWLTLKLSLPNMVLWHLGLVYGLTLLGSGRTAIIGYTMPVWALLTSVVLFSEKLTWRASMAVACSLLATLLLAQQEFSNFAGQPLGLVLVLGAAIAWGIGNAMMKNAKLSISSVSLTFWSLLAGPVVFCLFAIIFESSRWRWPDLIEWLAIAYGGLVTFALSYVAWFRVARKLSPVASGLSIMLVPVIGLVSGALMLGETIALPDIIALGFILLAMGLVLTPRRSA